MNFPIKHPMSKAIIAAKIGVICEAFNSWLIFTPAAVGAFDGEEFFTDLSLVPSSFK